MIRVKLAQRRVDRPNKGFEYFCRTDLLNHITRCGDLSNDDDGPFGITFQDVDHYFQDKFIAMFGDVFIWIDESYQICDITERLN